MPAFISFSPGLPLSSPSCRLHSGALKELGHFGAFYIFMVHVLDKKMGLI